MRVGSSKHIVSACKTSLTQGWYMWRNNQVLKSLVCLFENKQVEVNSLLVTDRDNIIPLRETGIKVQKIQTVLANRTIAGLEIAGWCPQCVVQATMRPDTVLYSCVHPV